MHYYCSVFQSFLVRKNFFNNAEKGFFKTEKREAQVKNPMTGKLGHVVLELYVIHVV